MSDPVASAALLLACLMSTPIRSNIGIPWVLWRLFGRVVAWQIFTRCSSLLQRWFCSVASMMIQRPHHSAERLLSSIRLGEGLPHDSAKRYVTRPSEDGMHVSSRHVIADIYNVVKGPQQRHSIPPCAKRMFAQPTTPPRSAVISRTLTRCHVRCGTSPYVSAISLF